MTLDDFNLWEDEGFVTELDERLKELESGKVKGYTWEEVEQKARKSVKQEPGK
jgi:hypothetical protein